MDAVAVLAAAFTVLAVLTMLPAVTAGDLQVDLAVNTIVATNLARRVAALAVSTAGNPTAVGTLTRIAVRVRGDRLSLTRLIVEQGWPITRADMT